VCSFDEDEEALHRLTSMKKNWYHQLNPFGYLYTYPHELHDDETIAASVNTY
jgi:hypothetical protein